MILDTSISFLPAASLVSTIHVAESTLLIAVVSSENVQGHPAMVQWPMCDGWEFAGGQEGEDEAAGVLDPPPTNQPRPLRRPRRRWQISRKQLRREILNFVFFIFLPFYLKKFVGGCFFCYYTFVF